FVGQQGKRRCLTGPVTSLAAGLQNRRDLPGERRSRRTLRIQSPRAKKVEHWRRQPVKVHSFFLYHSPTYVGWLRFGPSSSARTREPSAMNCPKLEGLRKYSLAPSCIERPRSAGALDELIISTFTSL